MPAEALLHTGVEHDIGSGPCLLIWLSEAALLRETFWAAGVAGSCAGFGAERAKRSVLWDLRLAVAAFVRQWSTSQNHV